MSMVDATPNDVRELAKDLLLGIRVLLELNSNAINSLNNLSQTFQDDGYDEYRDSVYGIQKKLNKIAEDDLMIAANSLIEFADLLEQARRTS